MAPSPLFAALQEHVPEPPLLAAGALGGPFVIASLTPLRNAMSNGAQDPTASFRQLYSKVLGPRGTGLHRLRVAFTGAATSVGPACPQWCVIGPAFHFLHGYFATPLALLSTAVLETFITYGSQSRNAQMAYNVQASGPAVPLFQPYRPWGPGACLFVLRNACGMGGIRWLSPSLQGALRPVLPSGPREVVADLLASMLACAASAPLNLAWTYTVTSPALWGRAPGERCRSLAAHFRRQYLEGSGSSRLAGRDLGVRCVYIACCFTMFSSIERLMTAYWPAR